MAGFPAAIREAEADVKRTEKQKAQDTDHELHYASWIAVLSWNPAVCADIAAGPSTSSTYHHDHEAVVKSE